MTRAERNRVLEELRSLSDEELKAASLEKENKKRGNHTERANLAQLVRCERSGSTMFHNVGMYYPKSYIEHWDSNVLGCDYGGCLYDDYGDHEYS